MTPTCAGRRRGQRWPPLRWRWNGILMYFGDSKSEGGQKSGQPVPKEAGYQAVYSSTGREADEFRELQDDDGELPF